MVWGLRVEELLASGVCLGFRGRGLGFRLRVKHLGFRV